MPLITAPAPIAQNERCNTCGQRIPYAHKEFLNKMKLTMLQKSAKHVMKTKINDFRTRDIADPAEFKTWHNFQKLRYHGLITPIVVNSKRIKGRWLITRTGWQFLSGYIDLPKYVTVRDNSIIMRSKDLINVKDVYRASEAIDTTFEYVDQNGITVGVFPNSNPRNINQAKLI